jgi:hypothetical protein
MQEGTAPLEPRKAITTHPSPFRPSAYSLQQQPLRCDINQSIKLPVDCCRPSTYTQKIGCGSFRAIGDRRLHPIGVFVNKTIHALVLGLAISGGTAWNTAALAKSVDSSSVRRVGDFSLLDQQGYFHQMSYYDDHKAIALLVQANGSKATAKAITGFKDAQARYEQDKRVKFFMINPLGTQTRSSVQQDIDQYGVRIPVLMDDTQLVSESLGIDKTGEVFLFDPKSFTVVYRGPADAHFTQAIDAVLAGKVVPKARVKTKGPAVTYAAKRTHDKNEVSYSKDVAPILADNCARCHRVGGIAPFAMNNFGIVKGFAPMIREVLLTKRMPPGQIDPHVGHFKETYTLTPDETQKIVHWIEAGAKQDGDGSADFAQVAEQQVVAAAWRAGPRR